MARKQKLELTWVGKDIRPRLEPRILMEDPARSFHSQFRTKDETEFDNRLVFGDNLLALKALEQEFTGKIKCVYIDPPFNTGQAMENYEDGLEHSIWLSLMRERLAVLHKLISNDGTLFVHIDDNELAYLIVLLDEIFGRENRRYIVTFKQSSVSGPKSINPGLVTTGSYILVYSKSKEAWRPKKVYTATTRDSRYNKYIENSTQPYFEWRLVTLREALAKSEGLETANDLKKKFPSKDDLEAKLEEFVLADPSRVVRTARVAPKDINASCRPQLKMSSEERNQVFRGQREGQSDMYFLNGEQLIFYSSKAKKIDGEWKTGIAASTIWDDLLSNNLHKEGGVKFPKGKKPEALLKRLLEIATDPGDWVLDSFAGSGTTGAVAHKLGRRWVMIELGEHCHTHIIPRLKRVIEGTDQDGVSKAVSWKGGGGYRYSELAPSLLQKDKWERLVICKDYNPEMLSQACCKLEGFTYYPSDAIYWIHGHSTEQDFIYVTTQHFTASQLQQLSEEVGEERTLLVLCKSFRGKVERWPNLTVKKIPNAIKHKCEWGKDDYSLKIENLPRAPEKIEQGSLFDMEGGDE